MRELATALTYLLQRQGTMAAYWMHRGDVAPGEELGGLLNGVVGPAGAGGETRSRYFRSWRRSRSSSASGLGPSTTSDRVVVEADVDADGVRAPDSSRVVDQLRVHRVEHEPSALLSELLEGPRLGRPRHQRIGGSLRVAGSIFSLERPMAGDAGPVQTRGRSGPQPGVDAPGQEVAVMPGPK